MISDYFQRLIKHKDLLSEVVFKMHFRGPCYFSIYTFRKKRTEKEEEIRRYVFKKLRKHLNEV